MSVTLISSRQLAFRNASDSPQVLPAGFIPQPPDVDNVPGGATEIPPGAFAVLPAGVEVTLPDNSWILSSPEYSAGTSTQGIVFTAGTNYQVYTSVPPVIDVLASS